MKFLNKTILVVLIIFSLLNLCDIVTTIFIFEGEANPLFNMINNFGIMIFLKLLVVSVIWIYVLRNLYPNNMSYFMLLSILVYGSLALLLAQIININGILHPEIIEQAASVSVDERAVNYFWFMNVVYIFPILFSLLTFWIYDRSHNTAIINKEIAKKNKWRLWKIQQ